MSRRDRLLHGVYQQLGANRVQQRWVLADRAPRGDDGRPLPKGYEQEIEGLAYGDGTVVVSPSPLVRIIIHEMIHRAFPRYTEAGTWAATAYLEHRMSDAEKRDLYEAYARKVKIIKRPTAAPSESEE